MKKILEGGWLDGFWTNGVRLWTNKHVLEKLRKETERNYTEGMIKIKFKNAEEVLCTQTSICITIVSNGIFSPVK